jgi:PhzF family phenazine biosynthesis protein
MPSSKKLSFHIIDVFTATRYQGNPLAIVHVPLAESKNLTQEQKQTIAREFNLSETVFIHENSPDLTPDVPINIDIFTTDEELPFAGHPTVGSSWFLLSRPGGRRKEIILKTKAGNMPAALLDSGRVRVKIPTDFKEHHAIALPLYKSAQTNLRGIDYANATDGAEAVASIVKGVTYVLLRLNSESALEKLQGVSGRIELPGLGEWQGFVGLYAYYEHQNGNVRARMFMGNLEDPATGSAAATLGGWLGRRKGSGKWTFEVIQGVEMGRRSEIEVFVEIGEDGRVEGIELSGNAVEVAEGSIAF